jgi:hypothetical protein
MSRPAARRAAPRRAPLVLGLAALSAWLVWLVLAPVQALRGWHIGFVYVASLSVGALTLVLIQRLVGGRWREAFAPELVPATRATPVLIVFALPVVVGAALIFPWAQGGQVEADVRALYLNVPLFDLRAVAGVLGWSLIAWLLPRIEGPHGRLGAGLALAFHGLMVSVLAIDWLTSVQPGWTSSNIGMEFAVDQLALAAGFAALQARARVDDDAAGDVGGLLFATVIGLIYLEFMAYLVIWYGDKPKLDVWYLVRASWPWQVGAWIALAFALAAIVLLAARRAMGSHRAVAWAGGCTMAGVLAFQVWQIAPGLGAGCLAPATLALIAQGCLWLALATGAPRVFAAGRTLAHGV